MSVVSSSSHDSMTTTTSCHSVINCMTNNKFLNILPLLHMSHQIVWATELWWKAVCDLWKLVEWWFDRGKGCAWYKRPSPTITIMATFNVEITEPTLPASITAISWWCQWCKGNNHESSCWSALETFHVDGCSRSIHELVQHCSLSLCWLFNV